MEPQIRYAKTSDGVSIAWCVVGDGPCVLRVPAPCLCHVQRDWETSDFFTRRSRRARWAWYDSRGCGLSDRGGRDFSMAAMLGDLKAVVEAAAFDSFAIVAFGDGAPIAITYAAENQRKVSHLVLFDPWASPADYQSTAGWQVQEALRSKDPTLYLEAVTRVQFGSSGEFAGQLKKQVEKSTDPGVFAEAQKAMESWEASHLLAEIAAPTLVIVNRLLQVFVPGAPERIAARIPDSRLVFDDDWGHARAGELIDGFLFGDAQETSDSRQLSSPIAAAPVGVILFADIVDSTALTERLGDAAFRAKARDLDAALRTVIREHSGTAIEGKLLGDGVLAVFTSARQAIEAALACGTAGNDAGLPLHLGLHAGDVIREENNVYGGAVNVASRISALSAPSEVLVSETVRSLARTSAGVRFEDRGEQALKGVGEPVRVWAVREPE